ncbi:MAG: response regulator transcription factor [Bdellovibrionales bacterium]|nr:response regulator transcription factor [Bdellovibrionales bacterium]
MAHLWVLEDDEDAILLYQKMFQSGFEAEYFKSLNDLRDAISKSDNKKPELLIADLHLPDGEFTNFLGANASLEMPFAVVSASDDYKILQDCFKKGARDFFVKPVNKNEILFKINRILNEKGQSGVALAKPRFKDLTLDTFTQTVTRENVQKIIQLTQTEYKILALFFRNPERRLNREEIIGEVWKSEALSPKAFDFHLSKLREKLRELNVKINYQTNEGYCLIQE